MKYMIRGIDKNIMFRFFAVDTTEVVEQAREYHNTTPVASAALGRMLTAGLLVGYTLKNEQDKVTIRVNGNGPVGTALVTADSMGNVKGYLDNGNVELPLAANGKLNVGAAVGRDGFVQVIKDIGLKEPYSGSARLVSGEIGEDIAAYYFHSEQQPTVIGLGVLVDKDHSIKSAGGFMLQLMPGLTEEEIVLIENSIGKIKNVSSYFENGDEPENVIRELLPDFELEVTEKIPVQYKCDCSVERMEQVLISLGEEDLEKIIREDEKAEIVCHFCNKRYTFNKDELESIMDKKKS
ncbi:molecular chaperone Hsp33 [Dethiosulfatibacter aminovorans DSM 17477]|uniref:33 kDa chaperonin n=1 Tax=Dethiosulfatibacter aminovorans DSM 17477 TaxID=1121476 RepID=A0A1M6K236_9FIRM|nr:Hsp33 family molecular chaperone HslO [Dethiosulfatibacter aminovorans]SHJ53013.1 molecular chaperone Hsp33 [Dethiosulfatibacter aminovorans DSM 17477]